MLPIFQSNAANVRCHGPGIQKILLQRNEFVVDASGGGNNILIVAVLGPNGQCDVAIRHLGNNIYNVTYTVKDAGQYTIIAKWGEESIPGSPYELIAA